MKINLIINGTKKQFDVPAGRTLIDLLRAQGYWSVKHGCENGDCGNCTVDVDGVARQSCCMLAAQADGKTILTLEGLTKEHAEAVKACLMDFGDPDCGFCIPGILVSLKALLGKIPDPTDEEIVDALSGHHCHCTQTPKPYQTLFAIAKEL